MAQMDNANNVKASVDKLQPAVMQGKLLASIRVVSGNNPKEIKIHEGVRAPGAVCRADSTT